jgi:hypothetical protein
MVPTAKTRATTRTVRLPADYKLTAEPLPGGWFRLFACNLPPEDGTRLLGDYPIAKLDHLGQLRASGETAFPHPVYPEPGGVLQWGGELALRSTRS